MANVGILSMQRILNYGSFLQAYALRALLTELGHQVSFVDYTPGPVLAPVSGGAHPLPGPLGKAAEALGYDAPLRQRIQYILYKQQFSRRYHPLLGLTAEPNLAPKLDTLVIGSDEVFNCVQGNPNVGYAPELFGAGHRAERLISYAASFGNTTLEKLERCGKAEEVGGLLGRFDALSVRDVHSAELVRQLAGREPEQHLDPVLAYPFLEQKGLIPTVTPGERYLILYAYSGRITRTEAEQFSAYAKRRGWKVYAIGGVHPCADRFLDCSPFEVLAWFSHAEAVVTDTFHGTIFSILTHRPFATLVRNSAGGGYGNEEKLTDLLCRLGLSHRILSDLSALPALLETKIDYAAVEAVLARERARTKAYLARETGGEAAQ